MVILSDSQQPTTPARLLINHHGCCEAIQIVLKEMKVDGQRNLLGHIDENEIPKDMLNGMCIHFEVSTIDIW